MNQVEELENDRTGRTGGPGSATPLAVGPAIFPIGNLPTQEAYDKCSAADIERAASLHGLRGCLRSRLARAIA